MTRYDVENILESAVDTNGLATILYALEEICLKKAEHLELNWQDSETARLWSRAASRIDAAAAKILDSGL